MNFSSFFSRLVPGFVLAGTSVGRTCARLSCVTWRFLWPPLVGALDRLLLLVDISRDRERTTLRDKRTEPFKWEVHLAPSVGREGLFGGLRRSR